MTSDQMRDLRTLITTHCAMLRKGAVVTTENVGPVEVVTIDAMPPADAEVRDGVVKIDVHFAMVAVDKAALEPRKPELLTLLHALPADAALPSGPSYITLGAALGDQGLALMLFAMGEALGLWRVVRPDMLGYTGADADRMAGAGYVMCTGLRAA